jgi:hypothetical protein
VAEQDLARVQEQLVRQILAVAVVVVKVAIHPAQVDPELSF